MKLVHLADTHLGARRFHYTDDRGRNLCEQDIYTSFAAAVEKVLELRPAILLHAGDLFDGYHPSAAALGVALDQFARLREAEIEVVVIAGNHSTPRTAALDHPFALLERFGVHAVHGEPRLIRCAEMAVMAIPHSNDREELRRWIAEAEPDAGARFNVMAVHVGLEGLGRVGAAEAGSVELSGEVLEETASFDYIALGHLHKFDRIRLNAAYAGSLERLSWADRSERKGLVEVDLSVDPAENSFIEMHEIAVRRQLVLPAIDASEVDNLTDEICAAADVADIDGAIVKLPIRDVALETFGAINRHKINEAFAACMHFELDPIFLDCSAAVLGNTTPQDLREFLARRKPPTVDLDIFLERAETYMTRAAEELGA